MSLSRAGCCADWPNPCSYHEGVLDALDIVRDQIAEFSCDLLDLFVEASRGTRD